tara:strand:+ start:2015 stop:2251 length:237 start_codon:yes stop_codon:yes gene_type:complete
LIIPDRLGNKRADTFENLLINSELGIIFLIPGFSYILRVSGTGQVIRDAALQARFAIRGKEPDLLLAVTVAQHPLPSH